MKFDFYIEFMGKEIYTSEWNSGSLKEAEEEINEALEIGILSKMCEKCESEKLKWVEKEGCKDELYVCENCGFEQPNYHSEAEEIKTDKDEFVSKMINEDKDKNEYKLDDIHEFADMYLQNLNTMEENIRDFKEWVKEK